MTGVGTARPTKPALRPGTSRPHPGSVLQGAIELCGRRRVAKRNVGGTIRESEHSQLRPAVEEVGG